MPLIDVLSVERFSTYRLWAAGNDMLAERLYSYNILLSSELYSSLHMLEVALRNKVDQSMIAAYGADWLDDVTVLQDSYQQRCVADSRASLVREGKSASHNQMVAELNFGFWSSMFGRSSQNIWGTLRPIFKVGGLQRGKIAGKLRELRRLRNRVAHYEPILALPLTQLHRDITDMAGWLSPDAATWIYNHSDWGTIHPGAPLLVQANASQGTQFDRTYLGFLPR